MKNRKLVFSLVALAGLSSLSAQAQTNNTEKPHETIMQRVDTLEKKVGSDVKHAEGVEKAKLNAEAQKVGAAVKKAETTEKAKLNADKQRVKADLAKDKEKVNKVYQDDKAKFNA